MTKLVWLVEEERDVWKDLPEELCEHLDKWFNIHFCANEDNVVYYKGENTLCCCLCVCVWDPEKYTLTEFNLHTGETSYVWRSEKASGTKSPRTFAGTTKSSLQYKEAEEKLADEHRQRLHKMMETVTKTSEPRIHL